MIEKAEKFLEFNPERGGSRNLREKRVPILGLRVDFIWGRRSEDFERERVGPEATVRHSSAESLRTKERVWGRQPVVG